MKISLTWLFDHLEGSWHDYDVDELVSRFNRTTAEIESYKKIVIDLGQYALAHVVDSKDHEVVLFCREWNKEVLLPARREAQIHDIFLIKRYGSSFAWASLDDMHADKEGLFPAVFVEEKELDGSWKNAIEQEDYIFTLENKTITHRPDLWGHRGIAREIAAIYGIQLKSEDDLLAHAVIKPYETFAPAMPEQPFTIGISDIAACDRFAGVYFSSIVNKPSILSMALRLVRLDARPINAIVDITNYVMFDWSQPLHAFDSSALSGSMIGPVFAHSGQTLTLLDGSTIELSNEDLVISDNEKPLALAGIMGGKASGVSSTTQSIFVEAAHFNATVIRKTAQRHKLRTEASTRFEKTLDPMQNVKGLQRFIYYVHKERMIVHDTVVIHSVGLDTKPNVISLTRSYINKRLGVDIPLQDIKTIFTRLGFAVEIEEHDNEQKLQVMVPTYRGTKDITLPEDLVEEVARFYGFDRIPLQMPAIMMRPWDSKPFFIARTLKNLTAFSLHAHEVQNYALFDEEFLHSISWKPDSAVSIANPVSDVRKRLVTSLVPHLVSNVIENKQENELRFFEMNRCWHLANNNGVEEREQLAGIFFKRLEIVDFYKAKQELQVLFDALSLDVAWQKLEYEHAWLDSYKSASLWCDNMCLGYAGTINKQLFAEVAQGNAFIFEFDVRKLLEATQKVHYRLKPLSKYPSTSFDVSMFVPLEVSVATLESLLKKVDALIKNVELIDFYEKKEWQNKRSVTLRCQIVSHDKTLTSEDIERIREHSIVALQKEGMVVR